MSNLTIQELNSVLVVDSRLIAESLGIAHKNLLATIDKYKQQIESTFGIIAFETRKSKRGKPEKFAWLNEEQTTFLMTLSRNTERVVQCKVELVKAFAEAKRIIKEVIPAATNKTSNTNETPALPSAQERLETIKLGMDLFSELGGCDQRTQLLLKDQVRNILLADKLQPSPTAITTPQPRLEYPVSDRAASLGYRPSNRQLQQIGKQASRLYQERHGTKPIQREQFVGGATRMVNVYSFSDVDLLDQAIFLVMDK